MGLRVYLTWITSTGYTYGALATPIAFLLFAFFLGFAIMLGAELNAAIQEEWPASTTHAKRVRSWLKGKAESLNGTVSRPKKKPDSTAATAGADARPGSPTPPAGAGLPAPPAGTDAATS